jgi:hypothetical protein
VEWDKEESQRNPDFNISLLAELAMLRGNRKEAEEIVDSIANTRLQRDITITLFELQPH